ncbi:glycosyltransferase [Bifidobacterium choloepi]|uniref:Glycosyltransferase family 1 protein n=1 Tax=Bifidobacterium choloepi TaxID=2614131 RepID=A0A6I5N3W8_9BIFI|nr:glycosyltransferase [Bifidobacterium choloepi]NEG70369.1 glycosyltransferase family 1 protein [Bifidobacterium choloepi]
MTTLPYPNAANPAGRAAGLAAPTAVLDAGLPAAALAVPSAASVDVPIGRPLRVLHVVGSMFAGGVESTILNHFQYIDTDRVVFDFLVEEDSKIVPVDEIERRGGRIYTVPPIHQLPSYLRACERVFASARPDIVHSHVNTLSVFPLSAAARAGIPVRIAHSHSTTTRTELLRHVTKQILRPFASVFPTHFAACSRHASDWLFGKRHEIGGDVFFMRNAIDLDRFCFSDSRRRMLRAELSLAEGQLHVGQIGRISHQKNQRFTLEIFADLLRRRPDARLTLIGEQYNSDVASRIESLGLTGHVNVLGVRDDVADFYSAFDVLMFPSQYEGFGIASIEAQASDLPVLASSSVPSEADLVPELVRHLDLSESVDVWSKTLETQASLRTVGTRRSRTADLAAQGYDIRTNAKMLEIWYRSLANSAQ